MADESEKVQTRMQRAADRQALRLKVWATLARRPPQI
jgi:hypothetical protein